MFFTRSRAPISDTVWHRITERMALLASLDPGERAALRPLAASFLERKSIEPVQGLTLDETGRVTIAALAALPVLEMGLDVYDDWHSLVVYPAGFLARGQETDEFGVVHEVVEARSGEAWHRGPVLLSFQEVMACDDLDGFNVVIHEMAHKLDMGNGDANGHPPLHAGMDSKRWYDAFSAAFGHLNRCLDSGRQPPLDAYAGESPAEFFAVASEFYFELPDTLRHAYPEVFAQLRAYYRPGRAVV